MKESDIFIEVDCFQKNKAGNIVCGDSYMSQKLKEEDRIISVLSDGLGSGIKASVLSAMTATMAMNYTAMNESILQTALSIIHTLPKDMVRKISYSTFCIFDIDCFGNTRIVEYESPAVYLFRRGQAVEIRKKKIPIEREDLENTYLWISEFKLEKEDRLICFSDGVSQSGMGSSNMPFGWDEGVGIYIAETLSQHPGISAKELARKIVLRAGTATITIVCWTTPVVVSFTGERRAICSSVRARLTMKKKTGIWQKKSGISKVKKYSAEERQPRLFRGNFNSPCRSVWISPIKNSPHSPIWKEST